MIAFPARIEPLLVNVADLMSFLGCEASLLDPVLDKAIRAIVCQAGQ